MRTYGRTVIVEGGNRSYGPWVVVETASNGDNSQVWITTLCQVCKLNLGESPFWANYGIPARNSVLQQTHPDSYMSRIQQQFAQYFANLIIYPVPGTTGRGETPEYNISAITMSGARLTNIDGQLPQ